MKRFLVLVATFTIICLSVLVTGPTVEAATSVNTYIKNADKLLKKDDPLGAIREIRKGMDKYGTTNKKLYNKAEEIRKHTQIVSAADYMLFMSSPNSPLKADSMLWDAVEKGQVNSKYFLKLETRKYIYEDHKLVGRNVLVNADSTVPKSWSSLGTCSEIKWESTIKPKNGVYDIGNVLDIKYDSEGRIISYTFTPQETVIGNIPVFDTTGFGGFTSLCPAYYSNSTKNVYSYEYDAKGRITYLKKEVYKKNAGEWIHDYSKDEQIKTTYNSDGSYIEEATGDNAYAKSIYDKKGNLVETENRYNGNVTHQYFSDKYIYQKTNEYISPATNKYSKDGNFHLTVDTKYAKVKRDKKGRIIKSEEFENEYNEYTYDSKDRLLEYKTYDKSLKCYIAKMKFKYESDGGLSIYQYQAYDGKKLELYSIDKYDKNGFKSEQITPESGMKYITYYEYPYFSCDTATYAERSYYYAKDGYKQGYLIWSKGVDGSFPESELVDDFGNTVYRRNENSILGPQYPVITKIKYHYDSKYVWPAALQ